MNGITSLKNKILHGYSLTKEDAMLLVTQDLEELCKSANDLRDYFCGNSFDLCTIINGKSGKCTEDCKFCSQSSYYDTFIKEYPLLHFEEIKKDAIYNQEKGILRYAVVTSGKCLTDEELEEICKTYAILKKDCTLSLCASHGLLSYDQFLKLNEAGITRYHNNLETSKRNFKNICTTHTYEQKVTAIQNAIGAGLEVCSGGILGLGETMEDRIDMALDLKRLGVQSIPVNVLNPISGTPFENLPLVTEDEVRRTIAIFRFILPRAVIRMAGGRGLMNDSGREVFLSGANAAISGDMLTTTGITIDEDMKMLNTLGYEVKKI